MKIQLAGQEIQSIRNAFGMDSDSFARVLAVHPGTVRRWEGAGINLVPVDGIAASVLLAARQRLSTKPPPSPAELRKLGEQVMQALVVAGALMALALLIAYLLKD